MSALSYRAPLDAEINLRLVVTGTGNGSLGKAAAVMRNQITDGMADILLITTRVKVEISISCSRSGSCTPTSGLVMQNWDMTFFRRRYLANTGGRYTSPAISIQQ
jgi:hypothetical protein